MYQPALFIQVPQRQQLRRNFKITEPINPLRIWPTLSLINQQRIQIRPTAARQNKGSRMPIELQVLHIMVMPSQIQMHLMLP